MANNNSQVINILNWNANGLKRQSNLFDHFLHQHQINIACISETHLIPHEKLYFSGYTIYRNDRPSDTASGGVAIVVSNKIQHQLITSPNSSELETVAIKTRLNSENYNIIAAYKPPKYKFPLLSYKKLFNNNNNKIILIGDLNSKNKIWGCNVTTQQGIKLQSFISANNLQIVSPNTPTYYAYNDNIIPDILDITITTKNVTVPILQTVLPELDSDHCPVILSLQFPTNRSPSLTQNTSSKGKINWNKFQELLEDNIKYPSHITSNSALDNNISEFINTVKHTLQLCTIPYKHTFSEIYKPIPFKILNLIKSKHNLRRYWQITRRRDSNRKSIS